MCNHPLPNRQKVTTLINVTKRRKKNLKTFEDKKEAWCWLAAPARGDSAATILHFQTIKNIPREIKQKAYTES
jgi:hypothetical protein